MLADSEVLSPRNHRLKRLRRLVSQRRYRDAEGVFVVEGPTLVDEALTSSCVVHELYVEDGLERSGGIAGLLDRALTAGIETRRVAPEGLATILSTVSPQPIAAIVASANFDFDDLALDRPVLVVVDGRDPGNVGALCRTAEAAGFAGLVLAGSSVDPTNPKVIRSGAGATLRLPVVVDADPVGTLERLRSQGRTVWATAVAGESTDHDRADLASAAIVLGNEAHGLDPVVRSAADGAVSIALDGPTESLNVAAAGAVLCFESLRQRRQNSVANPVNPNQVEADDR